MKHKLLVALTIALAMPLTAQAEEYAGLKYHSSLTQVRARFPNARFEPVTLDWLKTGERAYAAKVESQSALITVVVENEFADSIPAEKLEDALWLTRVRVIPLSPVAIERVVRRYGTPEVKTVDPTFTPAWIWTSIAVVAYLDEQERYVESFDYLYTADEKRSGIDAQLDLMLQPDPK